MLFSCLTFTACDNGDDEDTNQYKGGISLNVFGPSPVSRGGVLRFLGSGMDKVTAVVIPGCDDITDIEVVSDTEIRVTVPQTAQPGLVVLKTPKGDITTKTELTFTEPIALEAFAPAEVKPGSELTITGEYLNLIKEVIFADEVTVPADEFVSQSRQEIKVIVPDSAQTGKFILSDGAEIPNWIYSEGELEVTLPSVEAPLDLVDKKPGDVIRYDNGKTVEILNTDAEGRLILADALLRADALNPATVIDVATLTGACIVALGHDMSGLFTEDAALQDDLRYAADAAGDAVWPMPVNDEFRAMLKSAAADLANIGPAGCAGASTAAAFLSEFAPSSCPWAHLDVAGTANTHSGLKHSTGRPLPLLMNWLNLKAFDRPTPDVVVTKRGTK